MFRGDGEATRKLSAAWLIDACGWKGHRDGDAGVSPDHALVLVNHGAATGMQLLALAQRIAASVHQRFDVMLEPEPRIIGADWCTSASLPQEPFPLPSPPDRSGEHTSELQS